MKKSIFNFPLHCAAILLMHFVFALSAHADPVSLETAIFKAQRFLNPTLSESELLSRGTSAQTFKLAYEAKTANKAATCFYVLNRPSSEGYIIMSADDRLPEVLGYSDNGEFDINKIPDNMKWWLSEYERQIELVLSSTSGKTTPPTKTANQEGWTEIEPLVKTKWNQSAPYNNSCPTIDGKNTLTGCVATAMSQIMKYHEWPKTGRGSHSYEWNGQTLSMDFSQITFDWDNMLDVYNTATSEYSLNETITHEQYLSYTDFKQSTTDEYCLEASNLTNITSDALNGEIQLLLTDNNGNFIRPVGRKNDITNLPAKAYYTSYPIYNYSPLIPSDISDGLYRLYLVFKPSGSTEWSMVQRKTENNTYQEYYIIVSKTGAYYTIEDKTFTCSYSKAQGDAVATLMLACGISDDMSYGLGASGAVTYYATQALSQYFDYDAKWLDRDGVETSDWENLIYTELENNRPVLYSGTSNGGGHAFVCDGYEKYDNGGYFHINWGWGGYLDGNFLLSVLDPDGTGDGYSQRQGIIYGIRPVEKVKIDGVYYNLFKGGDEAIACAPEEGYYTGELTIPETVTYGGNTYTVTGMTNNLGDYCQDLTSLVVYAPINEITFGVWNNPEVEKLETIKLYNVSHIGDYAFYGCKNLKTLELGESLESIGNVAFQNCNALTELIIPDKVTSIGNYAFNGCKSLTTLQLGENLKTIGDIAFYNCIALTELIIPEKVESIGENAFAYGQRLKKIVIPNSVRNIGAQAFYEGGTYNSRTIVSQIEEPFSLTNNTFSSNAFTRDELYVPYRTIEKYQATEIWKEFKNTVEYLTVSVGADGLATYCPAVGVDFSKATDIAAYKASVSDGSTVNLTKVTKVAKGEGVLLRSLSGDAATEYLPVAANATENTDNAFVGVLEDTTLSETDGGNITNFVLSKVNGVVGFFKANDTKVAAGKAYLPVEGYAAGARGLGIVFDDETTTGISEIEGKQTINDDAIYTLDGVRVKNPTKGLYIKNGKKVVIK